MNRNIMAAVDIGGFAVCVAIGAHLTINRGEHFIASGFLLLALAFVLSSFMQTSPEHFDMRALGVLQALAFSGVLVLFLSVTARMVA